MADPAILALDLGTSGAKAALLDLRGAVVRGGGGRPARAAVGYPTAVPVPGAAEQDPRDWLRAARESALGALAAAGPVRPAALAVTGQMQDLVVLDAHGESIGPALLYSDTRSTAQAERLRTLHPRWEERAGARQDATAVPAQWMRRLEAEPGLARRAAGIVLGPAGHLVQALGLGRHVDDTTASAAGLLDLERRDWDAEACAAAGLPMSLLPRRSTRAGEVVGRTGARAASLLGLPAGIPVVLALGDAAATTAGTVGLAPGSAYAYLGSSGWLARVAAAGPADAPGGAAHRLALPGPGAAAPELRIAALLAAGSAAAWGRAALLDGASPARADVLLERREKERGRGPSGLLALPSIHGERFPVRDQALRAAIVGADATTRGIDLYAAVLEGVAHALAHGLDAGTEELVVVGGGARSAPWRRILADVTGRTVRTAEDGEAALVGAAIAAADALGLAHRIRPLGARPGAAATAPQEDAAAAHASRRRAHRALYDLVAGLPGADEV